MVRRHKKLLLGVKTLVVGVALCAAHTSSLLATELQKQLVVTDAVVRLSDIFTDTGATSETIVMEAPAPGKKLPISSYDLVKLAKKFELNWERPAYLKRIYVYREGTSFSLNELASAIIEEARQLDLEGDVEVKVFGRKTGLKLPYGFTVEDIALTEFQLNEQRNRFSAILDIPTGSSQKLEQRISGTIEEVRLVPMFARVMAPGEIITERDLDWKKYPVRRLLRDSIVSSSQLIGQTVRRAIPATKLLRENDIAVPIMVAKGSIVSVTYKRGRLVLTMQGRALENGGAGETIRLMNQKSKKTVFAKVISDGHVEVTATNSLKLASS